MATQRFQFIITARDRTRDAFRGIRRSVSRLRRRFLSLRGAIAGAIGGGAIAAGVARTAKKVDDIAKAARRLGVGVGFISRFAFSAELAGSNLSQLERGIKNLNRAVGEATDGGKEYEDAINRIGLETEQLDALDPATRFLTVATALGKLKNEATQTAVAQTLLGRSGFDLIPLMEQIATNLEGTVAAADDAGAAVGEDLAAKAEKLVDQMTILNQQVEKLHRELLELAADNQLVEGLGNILKLVGAVAGATVAVGRFFGEAAGFGVERVARPLAESAGNAARDRLLGEDREVKQAILDTAAATKQLSQQRLTGTFTQ